MPHDKSLREIILAELLFATISRQAAICSFRGLLAWIIILTIGLTVITCQRGRVERGSADGDAHEARLFMVCLVQGPSSSG